MSSTPVPGCVNQIQEPPIGTGDPALAYSSRYNEFYYTTIGFSGSFCENGVFLYRSSNGVDWTRPVVPDFIPPNGLRTVVYWDQAFDCSVFHDKSYMTVDNSPDSPFYGRVYVTWTRFLMDSTGITYLSSPIMLAFSDNRGNTFSSPIEVSGKSSSLCGHPFIPANTGICNEDQFSVPVVDQDGRVFVAFENQQHMGSLDGFRDQYLVVQITPAASATGFSVRGPFLGVYPIFDGNDDYPIQTTGGQDRQTLCNSNFRINSAGNIAISPDDGTLYITWSDDRRHAGEFAGGVTVGSASTGYACPAGKNTDSDVFIIKSTDDGKSWTAPAQVNQDKRPGATNNIDQWYPWVTVSPGNLVSVVYHDRRYDTSPTPNKLARTTLASGTDLTTWTELDAAGFPSDFDNAFSNGAFIGDYLNVVAAGGNVYAVFTGVTPGKFDSDIFIFVTAAPPPQ